MVRVVLFVRLLCGLGWTILGDLEVNNAVRHHKHDGSQFWHVRIHRCRQEGHLVIRAQIRAQGLHVVLSQADIRPNRERTVPADDGGVKIQGQHAHRPQCGTLVAGDCGCPQRTARGGA